MTYKPNHRLNRAIIAIFGAFFLGLSIWIYLDPVKFPDHALIGCGSIAAVLLGAALFAPDKWIDRVLGLLTPWP